MKAFKIIRNVILSLLFLIAVAVIICIAIGWHAMPIMTEDFGEKLGSLLITGANGGTVASIPILGYIVYYCWSLPGKIILGLLTLLLVVSFFFDKNEEEDKQETENHQEAEDYPITHNEDITDADNMSQPEIYENTDFSEAPDEYEPMDENTTLEAVDFIEKENTDEVESHTIFDEIPDGNNFIDDAFLDEAYSVKAEDAVAESINIGEKLWMDKETSENIPAQEEAIQEIKENEVQTPEEISPFDEDFMPNEFETAEFDTDENADESDNNTQNNEFPVSEAVQLFDNVEDEYLALNDAAEEIFNEVDMNAETENSLIEEVPAEEPSSEETLSEEPPREKTVSEEPSFEETSLEVQTEEPPIEDILEEVQTDTEETYEPEEISLLRSKIDDLERQLFDANAEKEKLATEAKTNFDIMEDRASVIENLQTELAFVKDEHKKSDEYASAAVKKLEDEVRKLNEEIASKDKKQKSSEEKHSSKIKNMEETIASLKNELAAKVNMQNEVDGYQSQIKELETKLETTVKEKDKIIERKIQSAEDSKKAYRNETERLKKLIESANKETEALYSEITTLKSEHAEELNSLKEKLEMTASDNEKFRQSSDKFTKAEETYKGKIAELESNLKKVIALDNKNKEVFVETSKALEEYREKAEDNQSKFDSLSELYDLLYSRYTTTVEYLVNRKIANPEAFEREKRTFRRQ